MTEINAISQTHKVFVIECDAEVKDKYLYNPRQYKIHGKKFKGRGGTNMNPGLNEFNKSKDVEMIIIITDGYLFSPPAPVNKPELWVISSNGSNSLVKNRRHIQIT